MKTFLINNKDGKPVIKWGDLPNNTFFEGNVPEGYSLAISPSENIVILDVDLKNGKNGYSHIPKNIMKDLNNTFHYKTKSGGAHYYIKYTGHKPLINRATQYGLDLRIGAKKDNCGGYVKYHHHQDIRKCLNLIKESGEDLNQFLQKYFS